MRKSNGNLAANGTLYWSMTPGVVAETDLAGTIKSEYIFFDGERVARRDGPTGAGGVFYYFSDHLKTASVITDAAGVIKAESDYYPGGGELKYVDNDTNDYKFTGKKRDIETRLDYFGARYYANELGRWVSADWSSTPLPVPYASFGDPQTLNLYGYVGGNPASKADLDGHQDYRGTFTVFSIDVTGSRVWEAIKSVGREFAHFMVSGPGMSGRVGRPPSQIPPGGICGCLAPNGHNDNNKQNNNSQSSNTAEQGRDAQGRFTSKQPGQSAPGAAAEKKGLEAVGATKNKTEILNGTRRDGTIPETQQHVEVKSGESVSNTQQLRDMGQAAMDATGKPLKVVTTNPNVNVSKPAQKNGNLEFDHNPQK